MLFPRRDPGPCPVCGAEHTACTGTLPAAIAVAQLPARDAAHPAGDAMPSVAPAAAGVQSTAPAVAPARAPLLSESAALGPGEFTTATYRRPRKR